MTSKLTQLTAHLAVRVETESHDPVHSRSGCRSRVDRSHAKSLVVNRYSCDFDIVFGQHTRDLGVVCIVD